MVKLNKKGEAGKDGNNIPDDKVRPKGIKLTTSVAVS